MFSLQDLETIIASKTQESAEKSYTKSLLDKGATHTAKKFGEEAVEFALSVACQDEMCVKNEAADVLYHLLVALRARNITLESVLEELQKRTKLSGIEEKAQRGVT